VGFVGLLFDPVDCLVRAGELADAAELPPVEVPEPAVGTALGPVKFRHHDPPPVGAFALLEYPVGADLGAEVAALAPGLIDGKLHEIMSYVCSR
jgi:hypothetical protein